MYLIYWKQIAYIHTQTYTVNFKLTAKETCQYKRCNTIIFDSWN